jgi:ubiquinol-cytochrome c reductase cytochrome b subunit
VYAAKAGGFFFLVFGVVMLMAATVTINPVWNYGPYDPSPVSAGTQPDWYIGFADGALRLVPPHLETEWFGYTWSWNIIIPILVLLVFLALVFVYPFIEAWVTGDKREHHLLDRPRNAPVRTAIGAAGVTFYAVLWAGAASDIIATHFQVTMEGVILTLQLLLIFGPIIAFMVTKRIALALQKKDREIVLHGYETGKIVRLQGGEFVEVHKQLNEYDRWKLLSYNDNAPLMLRPNPKGKITTGMRIRASLSRFLFEDRIAPVSQEEYKKALEHSH